MSFCPTKRILPYGVISKTRNSFFMGVMKKLNGRPKLLDGKRSKKIDTRFTEEEFGLIQELEKELGLSKTELIRERVLHKAGVTIINARELLQRLDGIGAEMGRSGNNINQLAKHANTLKLQGNLAPQIVSRFNDLMAGYIKVYQQMEIALRKIIREMGK